MKVNQSAEQWPKAPCKTPYNWVGLHIQLIFFFLKVYKNPDSSYLKVDLQMTLFFSVSYTDFCDNKIYVPAAVWARLQSLIMVKNA